MQGEPCPLIQRAGRDARAAGILGNELVITLSEV